MSGVEWKRARCAIGVEARLGHLMLCAWDRADADLGSTGFAWRVDAIARDAGYHDTLMALAEGDGQSLDAAQTAAVNAARGLLVEAVGKLGCGPSPFIVIRDIYASTEGLYAVRNQRPSKHEFFALEPDDLIALGLTCLAAGVRAREGG